MGLHCLSSSFIDRPFLKMIYLSMVYRYSAQAPPEKHQLVRTCYLAVNLGPVRANEARGIRVWTDNYTESLPGLLLQNSASFYFAFIFPFLTLYF